MNIDQIKAGENLPENFNVIIEIPAQSHPIKYETDKTSGAIFVDRFLSTTMAYPMNYGFIPNTLSEDGDPTDVLVYTPFSLPVGAVIACRSLGILLMEDEHGIDKKIIAVPQDKVCPMTQSIRDYSDLPELLLQQISHFFSHYKDLELGKWSKVQGWEGIDIAHAEIINSVHRYTAE